MASPTLNLPSTLLLILLLSTATLLSAGQQLTRILPSPTPSTDPAVPAPGLGPLNNAKGVLKRLSREFLSTHNEIRAPLGEAPLVWDRRLARLARRWSEMRRYNCTIQHSPWPYGENMFVGGGSDWSPNEAVRIWADETKHYDLVNNSCVQGKLCGHYIQLVWNTTRKVGCARVECYGGGVIMTCEYDPAGNYVNERPY